MATLKFKVERVDKYQRKNEKVDRYHVKAENVMLRGSFANFKVFLLVALDISQNEKVPAIRKGSELRVTGKISNASILPRANAELHVDLMDAVIN